MSAATGPSKRLVNEWVALTLLFIAGLFGLPTALAAILDAESLFPVWVDAATLVVWLAVLGSWLWLFRASFGVADYNLRTLTEWLVATNALLTVYFLAIVFVFVAAPASGVFAAGPPLLAAGLLALLLLSRARGGAARVAFSIAAAAAVFGALSTAAALVMLIVSSGGSWTDQASTAARAIYVAAVALGSIGLARAKPWGSRLLLYAALAGACVFALNVALLVAAFTSASAYARSGLAFAFLGPMVFLTHALILIAFVRANLPGLLKGAWRRELAALDDWLDDRRTGLFAGWERAIAGRYLMTKRAHGGVALISIISFVGIMLAVAVLIVVMSVMNGFRIDLLDRLLGAQGHVFVYADYTDPEQTRAFADRLAEVPGVTRAAPVISGQAGVIGGDAFSGVIIYGLARRDLESLEIVKNSIRAGGIGDFGEGERGGDTILIGSELAARLGVTAGDPVSLISPSSAPTLMGPTFRRKTYTIGGVFSVGMSQIDDLFVYMPVEQARLFLGRGETTVADLIEVSVSDPDEVDAARAALQPIVRRAGGYMRDWRDQYASYVGALNVERNAMGLILSLLTVIAALNIISGLVMLAKNKGGDIAILRTVGGSRSALMRSFFLIGAAIGALGTSAGVLLGVAFCWRINDIRLLLEEVTGPLFSSDIYFLAELPARIEWSEVATVSAFGFVMSCVFTLPAAWNAARLDPVEALRYE